MSSSATREEIRLAYRQLARQHHPDTVGDGSAVRMAQINEAWHVLSDPGRRAMYDAQSRGSYAQRAQAATAREHTGSAATTRTATRVAPAPPPPPHATPARFPWRLMLVLAVLGIAFVLVNAALTKPSTPAVPDNLMTVGSCVDIAGNGDAIEVACDGSNDGIVGALVPFDALCPQDTETHRDHQGMGLVCVRLATVNR
ncbi:MAG: hypothetical protein JWM34_2086 [Ilumatobacteraceae bacterium]|nr:hypothetical protein [Ilumatobacteraceae bacterium]